jgi:hypothetical protein
VIDGKYIIKKEELGRGSFAITHLTVLEPNTLLACKMICKQKMLEKVPPTRLRSKWQITRRPNAAISSTV